MALKYMDSFDHYATADLGKKWNAVGSSGNAIGAYGRFGTNGYRCTTGNASLHKGIDPSGTIGIIGFAMYYSPGITGQIVFCQTYDAVSDEPMILFSLNIDGTITAWRANNSDGSSSGFTTAFATVVGTSVSCIGYNVWNYIEFYVKHHDSAGEVRINVNGVERLSVSSVDTRPSTRTFTSFGIGMGSSSGTLYFDDVYMADEAAGLNDVVGDARIECIYPTVNGNSTQWLLSAGIDHAGLIKEHAPDDDTTYIYEHTIGKKDTNEYEDVGDGLIIGVQVNVYAKKTSAGTKTVCPVYRQSGSDYDGGDLGVPASNYEYLREITEENPATSAAWTKTEINAGQFGAKITA